MHIDLAGEADFEGFRRAARDLLQRGVPPDAVITWRVAGRAVTALDFEPPAAAAILHPPPEAPPQADAPRVPADFLELCREVVMHADPQRHTLLYRLLWRLQHEPALRHDPLDAEMQQARHMAQAVRREMHKMKAFVRFREVARGEGLPPLHVAWFEPAHHIVEAVGPFFMRRFAGMPWAVLTPERSMRWDGERLEFGPGAGRDDAPPADAGEALWLTYYASIFNPARLKLQAMEKEMPRRYWRNLPESVLISGLSAQAAERSGGMVERAPQPVPARVRRLPPAGFTPPAPQDTPGMRITPLLETAHLRHHAWDAQRDAASACRECPLGALATQTVFGEGPVHARLMLVGEQPGDQEDLRGRPFVGPAGQLLARAMVDLGWPRDGLYVTNAVKHFKYEIRGKRRMHKTPAQREADACLHWLESEISIVQPQAVVALGATAARQLLGRPVAVLRERGQWLPRADGLPVLVTLHPSALLRADPGDREAGYQAWLADLHLADGHAGAAGAAGPAATPPPP